MTAQTWPDLRERAWSPVDNGRRCWTCGAQPSGNYPDGSPRYDCGPHEPTIATAEQSARWLPAIIDELLRRKPGASARAVSIRRDGRAAEPRAHARRTDPETSHAAAKSVGSVEITELQRWIFDALEEPMSDEQLWNALAGRGRLTPSGVRTRRSELVEQGFVCDSGRRTSTTSGRQSIVWQRSSQERIAFTAGGLTS